jgi:ribosomal protein S25
LNLGLAKTARKLKIKLSTAKSILRAFRNKGKILRKKYIKRTKAKYTSNVENLLP